MQTSFYQFLSLKRYSIWKRRNKCISVDEKRKCVLITLEDILSRIGFGAAKKGKMDKMNCSSCYLLMEDVISFRINQLRNFGRQSKRLKSRNITLGRYSAGDISTIQALLSLLERFIVMLRQLSYAIKK